MKINFGTINYYKLILIHIAISPLLYYFSFLSKPFCLFVILFGFYYIVKYQNQNNEALMVSGYIVGCEVFFKMSNGYLIYEIAKYSVVFYLIMGIYYKGFSKNSVLYWIFLVLLIPSIIVATYNLNFETEIRKTIAFNISGPICLGVSAIYCYRRKISFEQLNNLILAIGLPIVSTVTYMYVSVPDISKYIKGTASNVHTSGGWASNQVATIVGLGMFCFFSRILFNSKSKLLLFLNLIIVIIFAYRGIATFSRGGMFTAFFMMISITIVVFLISNSQTKFKIFKSSLIAIVIISGVWIYTSQKTNGMINKRYANQDPSGREKASKFTGREDLFFEELQFFLENPILGIGVGKSRESRLEDTGIDAATHSEISRMLSEHGSLGLLALFILFLTPLILYRDNKHHIYLLSFFIFWFFTINHAAMRLAAPAFVYALSLLKVNFDENPLHRK